MNAEDGAVSPTLRREMHGHEPMIVTDRKMNDNTDENRQMVYDARGNGDGRSVNTIVGDHCDRVTDFTPIVVDMMGGKTGCHVAQDGTVPTITRGRGSANDIHAVCLAEDESFIAYENHAQDSRVKESSDVSPTINAKAGMGGGNLPLVQCYTKTAHPQNSVEPQGYMEADVAKTLNTFSSPGSEVRAEELVVTTKPICFQQNQRNECREIGGDGQVAGAVCAEPGMHNQNFVAGFMGGQGNKAGSIAYSENVSPTLKSAPSGGNTVPDVICVHAAQTPISNGDHANCIGTCNGGLENVVAIAENIAGRQPQNGGNGKGFSEDGAAYTVTAVGGGCFAAQASFVRRLMPVETERLMGFPDGHTIPTGLDITDELVEEFREVFYQWDCINAKPGKNVKRKSFGQVKAWLEKISNPATCPDAPRYKACGNSFGVNCVRWIGLGIESVQRKIDSEKEQQK